MMKKLATFFIFAFLLLPFVSQVTFASDAQPDVTVTLVSVFDEGNIVPSTPFTAPFGSTLTIDSPDHPTYFFAFWVVNGVVRYDLLETDDIVVTTNMNLQAVYSQSGTNAVLFMDSNGNLISTQIIADNGSAIDPSLSVTLPDKPGLVVATPKWKTPGGNTSLDNIVSDIVFILQYTVASVDTFTISVTGGTGSGVYSYNDIVTAVAEANDGSNDFSYWKDAVTGDRLSYQLEYSFTALSDRSIEAYYNGTVNDMPLVAMSDDVAVRDGYKTYVGQFYIPDTYELVEYGFIFSSLVQVIQKGDAGVTAAQSNKFTEFTNEYVISFPEDTHNVMRAYVVAKETSSGDIITVHSNNEYALSKGTDLFFSEYIEGSSNNKVLEIYNPTNISIDLSAYTVELYGNGSATSTASLTLAGTLLPGETYIIANGSSSPAILAIADVTSGVANFNGNDALVLLNGASIIDSIGQVGFDPGTQWTASGVSTLDQTLVRKSSVTTGRTSSGDAFDPSVEWDTYPIDTIANLGSHLISPSVASLGYFNYSFSLTPMINGTTNTTILVGDASYDPLTGVTSLDATDSYLNVTYTVTDNSNGDADVTATAISELPIGLYTIHYSTTNTLSFSYSTSITLTIETGNLPVLSGAVDVSLSIDDPYDPADGVTASDIEDGDLTSSITIVIKDSLEQVVASVDTSQAGTFTVTYSVIDSQNNTDEVVITVEVVEGVVQLSTPSNLVITYSSETLDWDAVPNADSYDIYVGEQSFLGVSTNSLDLHAETFVANQNYEVAVVANGDGVSYTDSAVSSSINYQRIRFADLIISEYIEGSGSNKYIEIYNGTGVSVDLSNYKLQLFSNGSDTATSDVILSGTLNHNQTIVYKNSSAILTLPLGVTATNNSAVNFSGDDAVALYKVSTASYVDIFGVIDQDPGSAWISGVISTVNQTLLRKSTIYAGVTVNPTLSSQTGNDFTTITDWDTYAIDTASYLGSHTVTFSTTESIPE